jgi:hypothetical protein
MTWLDHLRDKISDMELAGGRKTSAARLKALRHAIVQLLDENIAYLQSPEVTRGIGPREAQKPELLFKRHGDKMSVWLPYLEERIVFEGDNTEIVVPSQRVHEVLFALRSAVESGAFDSQMCAIKAEHDARKKKAPTPNVAPIADG